MALRNLEYVKWCDTVVPMTTTRVSNRNFYRFSSGSGSRLSVQFRFSSSEQKVTVRTGWKRFEPLKWEYNFRVVLAIITLFHRETSNYTPIYHSYNPLLFSGTKIIKQNWSFFGQNNKRKARFTYNRSCLYTQDLVVDLTRIYFTSIERLSRILVDRLKYSWLVQPGMAVLKVESSLWCWT